MPTMSQQQPIVAPSKKNNKPIRKPQKITQLICLDQNLQLKNIFITWLSESFKYFPNLLSKIYPELELIINFIEYRFTVSQNHSHVGDYLQNIKYKNLSKKIRILYLLLDVIGPYVKRRIVGILESFTSSQEKQFNDNDNEAENQHQQNKQKRTKSKFAVFIKIAKNVLALIGFLDKVWALGSFVNLAVFIYNGKYRSLIQRILKMQMQFVNPESSRVLDFTLMNRSMIWQVYEMALKNILPFMNKFLGDGLKNIFYLHSYMGVQQQQNNPNICAFCDQIPTMIVKSEPCQHSYCFYCSKNLDQDENKIVKCKKCKKNIQSWKVLYA